MGDYPFPLSLVRKRQVPLDSPQGCRPLPLRPHERMMAEWFGRVRRMCRLQSSFRAVNSPISCGARHGSRSDGVSEVPSAYEVCPLEPCKGGIRQRTDKRPARLFPRRERDKHPNHTPDPKIFGGSREPFCKRVPLWVQGKALHSSLPTKPQFENLGFPIAVSLLLSYHT